MLFSGRDCEVLLSPVLPRFSFLQKSCPKTCCLAYPSAAKGEEEIYLFDYPSAAKGEEEIYLFDYPSDSEGGRKELS